VSVFRYRFAWRLSLKKEAASNRQKSVPFVIARNEVTKQSMDQSMFLDCFASLAMTEYGVYRQSVAAFPKKEAAFCFASIFSA
jgi:hypothetical protein